MAKRKLTEQDFKNNPDLFYKNGYVIGDVVDVPEKEKKEVKDGSKTKSGNDDFENNEGDTGGSNPPPGKGRG